MIPIPYVALIVCAVTTLPHTPGSLNEYNSRWTGYQNFEFKITHGQMHCRVKKIPLTPIDGGDAPSNIWACTRAGVTEAARWDTTHQRWKVWKTACPAPIVDLKTGKIIAWSSPYCGGERGTVICEVDHSI
jgi:hypothetical protein